VSCVGSISGSPQLRSLSNMIRFFNVYCSSLLQTRGLSPSSAAFYSALFPLMGVPSAALGGTLMDWLAWPRRGFSLVMLVAPLPLAFSMLTYGELSPEGTVVAIALIGFFW
jgi:sugar phosphate permease